MRRPLFDTLRDLRGGEVIEDLAAQLQELVQAVQITGRAGSVTLRLDVKPMDSGTEAFVVADTITAKPPRIKSAGTVMFPTPEGNLTRQSQRQDELPGISLAAERGAA